MTTRSQIRRFGNRRGQAVIEFALSSLLLVMLILGAFEVVRILLVYTTVADAARVGARYAIIHGSDSPVSVSQIQAVVASFLTAPMNTASSTCPATPLQVCVTYPDVGCTTAATATPGCHVQIAVAYVYDAWTSYFGFPALTIRSTTQGVIAF